MISDEAVAGQVEAVAAWQDLVERLAADFPDVAAGSVAREVVAAQAAIGAMNLGPAEALAVGELIARFELLTHTGMVGRQPASGHDPMRR